jgi:myo-inositol-1(or 4)-monophosphatase
LDAYWASRLKAWDIAAGALIAVEAGATLTASSGNPFDPWQGDLVVAATPELHKETLECIHSVS